MLKQKFLPCSLLHFMAGATGYCPIFVSRGKAKRLDLTSALCGRLLAGEPIVRASSASNVLTASSPIVSSKLTYAACLHVVRALAAAFSPACFPADSLLAYTVSSKVFHLVFGLRNKLCLYGALDKRALLLNMCVLYTHPTKGF